MNIVEAAEILNVRHNADHLVVKAAYHALAKRHHPDQGGDTATMQRVNEAHNYMSTRTQQARQAEWERLQPKPAPQPDASCNASRKAHSSSSNPARTQTGPTTRPWKPVLTTRQKFEIWRYQQPRIVRWMLNLSRFLLILAGRLAVVVAMLYGYAESVRWAVTSLAHGAWVLLIFFPGIPVVLAGLYLAGIFSGIFLLSGWKGMGDYIMDRGPERLGANAASEAWARKNASRTRWI